MKEILFNSLVILYSMSSMFILGLAILFPFGIGMKDFHTWSWTGWIIYPLTLLIMASQRKTIEYFNSNQKK